MEKHYFKFVNIYPIDYEYGFNY